MTAGTKSTRIWEGIIAEDPPAYRHRHLRLLVMVEAMLAARVKGYPEKVSAGEFSQADANAEIRLFEALRERWRFIASGGRDGSPCDDVADAAICAALDKSLQTIADIARQAGEFSDSLNDQAQAVIALRWHSEPGRETLALARLTQQLRQGAAPNSRKAAA